MKEDELDRRIRKFRDEHPSRESVTEKAAVEFFFDLVDCLEEQLDEAEGVTSETLRQSP